MAACTGGLLQDSGQAATAALQAGLSIAAADGAAALSSNGGGPDTSGNSRIHEGETDAIDAAAWHSCC